MSTSKAFSTFLDYSNSSNTSNASIFMFDHSSPRIFREKCVKREFSLGKETFLWKKNFSWKNSLFLRFFSFSLSKFSFKMYLMKSSYEVNWVVKIVFFLISWKTFFFFEWGGIVICNLSSIAFLEKTKPLCHFGGIPKTSCSFVFQFLLIFHKSKRAFFILSGTIFSLMWVHPLSSFLF